MTISHLSETRGTRGARAALRRRRTRLRITAFPTRRDTTIPNLAHETEPDGSRANAVTWIGPAPVGRAPSLTTLKSVVRRSRRARGINRLLSELSKAQQSTGLVRGSDGKALAPLLTAKAENATAVCAAHPLHETVDAGTTATLGLPGSLHTDHSDGSRPTGAHKLRLLILANAGLGKRIPQGIRGEAPVT